MRSARARLVVVETLERRALLNGDVAMSPPRWAAQEAAATLDVQLDGVEANAITFLDADGTAGRVQLRGAGAATVRFAGLDLTTAPSGRTVRLTGTGVFIDAVSITGTTDRSTLSFKARGGDGLLRVNGITADGTLGAVSARPIVFTGQMAVAGTMRRLDVGQIENAALNIGGSPNDRALSLSVGSVTESDLNFGAPLASAKFGAWPGEFPPPLPTEPDPPAGVLAAPSIGRLTVNGDFAPRLNAGSLSSAKLGGELSGGKWEVGGALSKLLAASVRDWDGLAAGEVGAIRVNGSFFRGDITAARVKSIRIGEGLTGAAVTLTEAFNEMTRSLDKLTVRGGVTNLDLRSTNNVGALAFGDLFNSTIFVGVAGAEQTLPSTPADFVTNASISSVRIKEQQNGAFRARIAARHLGTLTLGILDVDNRGETIGLAGDTVGRLDAFAGGANPVRFMNLDSPEAAAAQVAALPFSLGDFALRIF